MESQIDVVTIPVSVDVTQRIHLDVKAGVGVRQESRYQEQVHRITAKEQDGEKWIEKAERLVFILPNKEHSLRIITQHQGVAKEVVDAGEEVTIQIENVHSGCK